MRWASRAGPRRSRPRARPGRAGAKGGLETGDIVLKIGAKEVTRDADAASILCNTTPGTKLTFELLREGKPTTLTLTVGKRPSDEELSKKTRRHRATVASCSPTRPARRPPASRSKRSASRSRRSILCVRGNWRRDRPQGRDDRPAGRTGQQRRGARHRTHGLVIQSVNYEDVSTAEDFAAKVAAGEECRTAERAAVRRPAARTVGDTSPSASSSSRQGSPLVIASLAKQSGAAFGTL